MRRAVALTRRASRPGLANRRFKARGLGGEGAESKVNRNVHRSQPTPSETNFEKSRSMYFHWSVCIFRHGMCTTLTRQLFLTYLTCKKHCSVDTFELAMRPTLKRYCRCIAKTQATATFQQANLTRSARQLAVIAEFALSHTSATFFGGAVQ